MRSYACLISCLLFLFTTTSLATSPYSSPVQKIKADQRIVDKITTPGGETYVIRYWLRQVTVDHFSNFLTLSHSNTFQLGKYKGSFVLLTKAFWMDSVLVVFGMAENVDSKDLVVLRLDPVSLQPIDDFVFVDNTSTYSYERGYEYAVSEDKKQIAVASYDLKEIYEMRRANDLTSIDNVKKSNASYEFFLLNNKMEVQKKGELKESAGDKFNTLQQLFVNDNGDIFAVIREDSAWVKTFEKPVPGIGANQMREVIFYYELPATPEAPEKTNASFNKLHSASVIYCFRSNGENLTSRINLEEKNIENAYLFMNPDKTYSIVGYYSDSALKFSYQVSPDKNAKLLKNIYTRKINGFIICENVIFGKSIEVSQRYQFESPVSYDEYVICQEQTKNGTSPEYYTSRIKINYILQNPGETIHIVSEVQGYRNGFSLGGAHSIPTNQSLQVLDYSVSNKSFKMKEISKSQFTYQESPHLLSYSTICINNGKCIFYNGFSFDPVYPFDAYFLLTGSHKSLQYVSTETGNSINDPEIQAATEGYFVFSEYPELHTGCKNILLFYNEKGYKLLMFS